MARRPNICAYLDMPLQHVSDNMLKSMRRGTTMEKTKRIVETIREKVPGIAIRTTLIAGYPGETKQDFEDLKNFVKEMRFDRLGIFTYSHEENTHAYNLVDDVPARTKKKRAEEIMAIQSEVSFQLNQERVGKTFKVLFDRKEGDFFIGRTEFDSPEVDNEVLVNAKDTYIRVGDFANVEITEATEYDLYGKVVA
jgi:ribosomal protein S12 methylthiotransferase